MDPNTPTDGLFIGDANDDGKVTGDDLIIVQQNFGNTLAPVDAEVPDPTSVCLLTLAGLGAMARRGRLHWQPEPLLTGDQIGVLLLKTTDPTAQIYDVTADGQGFVVVQQERQAETTTSKITVVQNWHREFSDGRSPQGTLR